MIIAPQRLTFVILVHTLIIRTNLSLIEFVRSRVQMIECHRHCGPVIAGPEDFADVVLGHGHGGVAESGAAVC